MTNQIPSNPEVEPVVVSSSSTSTGRREDDKDLHIAPMLDVSTREFRKLFRILSKRAVLWTEMVVDETIAHTTNELDFHLGFDPETQPIICQIGGNNPQLCGQATKVVEEFGYMEVNLNIDCPSDRVSGKREFGAVLMKKTDVAFSVLEGMHNNATGPTSVKCRVGIDEFDNFDYVADFIEKLRPVCKRFYLHARKCVLKGLNPAQNRKIPALNYPRVYALCERFPDCEFWINGGIPGLKAAKLLCYGTKLCGEGPRNMDGHVIPCQLCGHPNGSCISPPQDSIPNLRGAMLGRAAYENPSMFWDVDRYFYGEQRNPCRNRREVLEQYCQWLEQVYPKRCCDRDPQITNKITDTKIQAEAECCPICRDIYGKHLSEDAIVEQITPPATGTEDGGKGKISPRTFGRALKPIVGMFFGLHKNRAFRRAIEQLSRDFSIRNCGPAYLIRKALIVSGIPDELLDQDFVKTEDLKDINLHAGPSCDDICSQRTNKDNKDR